MAKSETHPRPDRGNTSGKKSVGGFNFHNSLAISQLGLIETAGSRQGDLEARRLLGKIDMVVPFVANLPEKTPSLR